MYTYYYIWSRITDRTTLDIRHLVVIDVFIFCELLLQMIRAGGILTRGLVASRVAYTLQNKEIVRLLVKFEILPTVTGKVVSEMIRMCRVGR